MHNIILRHKHALGDTVCVTALVRDIHRAFPGQYKVMVDTGWATVWLHNKGAYVADYTCKPNPIVVELDYRRGIRASQEGNRIHFLSWFHRDFRERTGLHVPLTEPRGELHLLPSELKRLVDGRYWVVVAGGKLDLTAKLWKFNWYQEVVDRLHARGLRFVQAGAAHTGHIHPPLKNVLSAVGRTGERELFNLIANADGVLCGVTAAMHIAAVFDKPCVVIAGGREEPWWESYDNQWAAFGDCPQPVKVPHRYLHTIGKLHCCASRGCWMKRTVPIEVKDETSGRGKLCKEPFRDTDQAVPTCMTMIRPEQVVDAVWSYYEDGTLEKPSQLPHETFLPLTHKIIEMAGPEIKRGPYPSGPEKRDGTVHPDEFNRELLFLPGVLPAAKTPLLTVPQERKPQTIQDDPTYDHPFIGGKFTIFVLCYGNYPELARRCLDGIFRTCPAERIQVRVAANACCDETIAYLRNLPLQRLYINEQNRYKYPVMREMFHDSQCPLDSNYLIWFDDDSYVVDDRWLKRLAEAIILNHAAGCRLYGWRFNHDLTMFARGGHKPDVWFRQASWYRGKEFRVRNTQIYAANGSCIDFVAGGFWALGVDAMRLADIPDCRLRHNGGDIVIGEQVHQLGWKIMNFNSHKIYVYSSGHEPRGVSQSGLSKRLLWDGKEPATTTA